jgi:hypothetical protein
MSVDLSKIALNRREPITLHSHRQRQPRGDTRDTCDRKHMALTRRKIQTSLNPRKVTPTRRKNGQRRFCLSNIA